MSPNQVNLLDPVLDFRAPPPSPIAAPRTTTTTITNDHILSNFLYNTLRVPDLILPDHIFPKTLSSSPSNPSSDIPVVNYQSLQQESSSREVVINSLMNFGCFQLINHGIESEDIELAVKRSAEVFKLSPEKKKVVMKTMEMGCGFEEVMMSSSNGEQFVNDDDDEEEEEEFIWCNRDDELRLRMDQVWPVGYPRFRGEMESLSRAIENILRTILLSIRQQATEPCTKTNQQLYHNNDNGSSSVCYIYKSKIPAAAVGQSNKSTMMMMMNSLGHDVIRMMVKGSHYTDHALSLHVCGYGSTEFQVYSKKGWVSFIPCKENNVLIVTSGDQAQKWTGKSFKSVIGRSIYTQRQHERHGNHHQFISMSFLYNPKVNVSSARSGSNSFDGSKLEEENQKIVSLRQQALFAILLTISCQLSFHMYYTFQNYFTG